MSRFPSHISSMKFGKLGPYQSIAPPSFIQPLQNTSIPPQTHLNPLPALDHPLRNNTLDKRPRPRRMHNQPAKRPITPISLIHQPHRPWIRPRRRVPAIQPAVFKHGHLEQHRRRVARRLVEVPEEAFKVGVVVREPAGARRVGEGGEVAAEGVFREGERAGGSVA